MNLLLQNSFWSLRLTLSVLYWTGFYIPKGNAANKSSYILPFFSFMFMDGTYVIAQFGDLCQVWGDVALMTGTSFLLFTNMSLGLKMFNLVWRKVEIGAMVAEADEELTAEDTSGGKEIIMRWNRESNVLYYCYCFLSFVTVAGWATSAEKGQLPMRAWYPYDTSKSPAYELTYIHQAVAVSLGATVNVSLDYLVTSLMAQCSCRLRLLALRLRTLGEDFVVNDQMLFSAYHAQVLTERLHRCIQRHQSALETAARLQKAYSATILVQVTVSMVIICVTAYQLAFETQDLVRFVSMLAYFLCMTLQLFLYCYQGNQLSEESIQVAEAAYEMPWYSCTSSFRRDLLMLMTRSRRVSRITAAGFTTLSLSAFMAIIKASYTFFTVLRSVDS
uniref:Odorant receptor n=1 Tax=Conogethes punctiferalis TaxID=1133088 RepID=A0A1Y9TJT0_CONPF|nr:odorant receptor 31 [Conogethes punctiferalis]